MIGGFQPSPPVDPTPPNYSRLGLFSFALGLLSIGLAGGFFVLAAALRLEQGVEPERIVSLGGLALLGAILAAALLGTGLGIAGLSRPARRKVFAWLGILLNGATLSLFCALVVLALWLLGPGGV